MKLYHRKDRQTDRRKRLLALSIYLICQDLWDLWLSSYENHVCTAVEETNIESNLEVMNITELVVEIRLKKNRDLCDTGAKLYQLS